MSQTSRNTQMFALRHGPPEQVQVAGVTYRLARVFKHDFWAATCLYEAQTPAAIRRIVVKFGRQQAFCGLPLGFYSRWLAAHEEAIYKLLEGIDGVPKCLGPAGQTGLAIEYVDTRPLDHLSDVPPGFFDRLGEIFEAIHARGVAYCDANKRSNILVAADGEVFLIDYQIAIARRDNWPWPLRSIIAAAVRYMSAKDIYHLCKHKRRLAPDQMRPEEEALSRRRTGLHLLHRKLTKPYRAIRRKFLQSQYAKGALKSPTAELEDQHQPEKATWRNNGAARPSSHNGECES